LRNITAYFVQRAKRNTKKHAKEPSKRLRIDTAASLAQRWSNDMQTLHLFAGGGGGLLADLILGHQPIAAVEWEPYACQVLRERAADGWFPNLRVHEGDVRLFDPSEYAGKVDCIHAGFPCQDISVAGNQAGVGEGTRSGLYREVLRIADKVRPQYLFLENVAAITSVDDGSALRTVIGDLASLGFDAVWTTLSASEIGAKHKRNRWWCLAYAKHKRQEEREPASRHREGLLEGGSFAGDEVVGNAEHDGQPAAKITGITTSRNDGDKARAQQASESTRSGQQYENVGDTKRSRQQGQRKQINASNQAQDREGKASHAVNECKRPERQIKSSLGGLADDVAGHMDGWNDQEAQVGRVTDETQNRADKLKCLGNGQVPLQAAVAFSYLWKVMEATQ